VGQAVQVSPWICTLLGLRGRLTRGSAVGSWPNPRPRWQLMEDWLGEPVAPFDARVGYSLLVERWPDRFGPGTVDDIVWWLGATTMGWKSRGFYLDPDDVAYLFDTNGNAGTTAWWNGRIVGCWVQEPSGEVRIVARRRLSREAAHALDAEAERLSAWLDGTVVTSVYSSRQMKGETLP
jgi:Winged helix DNA-binding domain